MTGDFRRIVWTIVHLPASACTTSAPGSKSPLGRGGGGGAARIGVLSSFPVVGVRLCASYGGVVDTLDTGVFTHLFTIPPAPPQISCRSASGTPSPLLALACRQAFGRGLTAIVHGRRRERRALQDERAEAAHMGGQRCRLSCVECGPAAWSCGPNHACQGVIRR